jgi:hypothetical protein
MKTRAAKFVAAMIASILSSASAFAAPEQAASDKTAQRADPCLTSPRDYTPPGTRWRYRVERGTGRHCWFLKDDAEKVAGKAAEPSAAATEETAPAPSRRRPATSRTVSDARAEFSQAPVEHDARPALVQGAAPAVGGDSNPASARGMGNMSAPAAATRWPDPAPALAQLNGAANPPAEQAAETRPAAAPATAPAKLQVMPRAVPPMPASDKPMSVPMLITVIAGGLSVLGVLVSLLFAWLSSRRTRLSPSAPMPPLEASDAPRRPGDLYRERQRMREQRGGRRAA